MVIPLNENNLDREFSREEVEALVRPMTIKVRRASRVFFGVFVGFGVLASIVIALMMLLSSSPASAAGEVIGMVVIINVLCGLLPGLAGRYMYLRDLEQVPDLLRIGERFVGRLVQYSPLGAGTMRHAVVEWDENGIPSGAHFDITDAISHPVSRDVVVVSNLARNTVAVILNGDQLSSAFETPLVTADGRPSSPSSSKYCRIIRTTLQDLREHDHPRSHSRSRAIRRDGVRELIARHGHRELTQSNVDVISKRRAS